MSSPSRQALAKLTPVLTKRWLSPDAWNIGVYERLDGYTALRKAFSAHPDDLIQLMKDSGLRGRGGAGFPTGMKWGFIPQNDGKPHYLVVNADEGEPGTCKDLPRGYLGRDILGSGFDLELVVHSGAGAYICGEETALLDSLEGYRGQPRLRPPFPATHGLYAGPTVVNNVETICSVPYIVLGGSAWWKSMGTEKSPGPKIYSISGRVNNPGQYECALGTTLRELIELAGWMQDGHQLKFWTPGGSSTPMLTAEHLDAPLDFESMMAVGTMLGTTAVQVFSDQDDVVYATYRWIEFYHHESCGKCTPCREGNYWMAHVLRRILSGAGTHEDLDTLLDTCDNLLGRAFCALGDGAASPVMSSIKYFKQDYLDYIEGRKEPYFKASELVGAH